MLGYRWMARPLSALILSLALIGAPALAQDAAEAPPLDRGSPTVVRLAEWALSSGDNAGLPFIIIDKPGAEVFVFDAQGRLLGAAPALLGLARGDDSVPGIGDRALSAITPDERTTPAGRFMAGYGPAAGMKTVFWVDYATAISLHPVITGNPKDHRRKRLASPTPDDNRITYGCINVPPEFYADVVRPTFKETRGVVYVVPEERPLEDVFPGLAIHTAAAASPDPAQP